MRSSLSVAALVAALLAAAPAASSPARAGGAAAADAGRRAPPPLSQVLARTFRFYGGVDAILAVGGLRLHGTIADGTTAAASRPTVDRVLLPPDRYRASVSLGGVEQESLVLDGARAFRDGAEVTGLARADQIRLEAARSFLPAALARFREALVDRGELRRDGLRVRRVELPLHRQASLTAEIDSATGQILRAVTRVAGREVAVSFHRLQPVEGVMFPFAEDIEQRDGKRTVLVDSVEVLPADSVTFEHP